MNEEVQPVFNTQIKDRTEINRQLEQFFKKGGKIVELKYGESTSVNNSGFNNSSYTKDSKDKANRKPPTKPSTVVKSPPKTETIFEEIQKEKKQQKSQQVKSSKVSLPKTDIKAQAEKIAQMRAEKLKKDSSQAIPPTQLPVIPAKPVSTPKVVSKSALEKQLDEELARKEAVISARKEAESKGLKKFIANCHTHGSTEYVIEKNNTSRCVACKRDSHKKRSEQERMNKNKAIDSSVLAERQRIKEVRSAREQAERDNKREFDAPCAVHGLTLYRVISGVSRCIACRKDGDKNRGNKKEQVVEKVLTPEELAALDIQRKSTVRKARKQAENEGKTIFTAPCAKHGMTTYYIDHVGQSRCKACKAGYIQNRKERLEAQQAKEKELIENQLHLKATEGADKLDPHLIEVNRAKSVQQARRDAEAKGLTEFTATCATHGETDYIIRYGTSRCVKCLVIQKEKRRVKEFTQTPEDAERKANNKKLLDAAVAQGKRFFIATCKNHGTAPHTADSRIKNGRTWYEYRCMECKSYSKFKTEQVRTALLKEQKAQKDKQVA